MVRHGSRAGLLSVVAVLVLITGCTGDIRTSPASGTGSANTGSSNQSVQGAAGCDSPSRITTTPSLGPEVEGSADNATLYGLIMAQTPMPVHADEDVKIVWRMTGSGPLQLSAVSPRGNGGSTPMGARGPRRQQLRPTRRRMGSWVSVPHRRMLASKCSAHYRLSGRMARSRGQITAQRRLRLRQG